MTTTRIRLLALPLLAGVLAAACGGAAAPVASVATSTPGASVATTTPAALAASAGLGERRSDAAAITIAATWLGGEPPSVRTVMDTHSVDLDAFDLASLARLRLDGGAWVAPSAWDAPKGGHHREGRLAFGALDRAAFDAATIIELEVRDVGTPSRILRWSRAG